jgi:hypothetical protein
MKASVGPTVVSACDCNLLISRSFLFHLHLCLSWMLKLRYLYHFLQHILLRSFINFPRSYKNKKYITKLNFYRNENFGYTNYIYIYNFIYYIYIYATSAAHFSLEWAYSNIIIFYVIQWPCHIHNTNKYISIFKILPYYQTHVSTGPIN